MQSDLVVVEVVARQSRPLHRILTLLDPLLSGSPLVVKPDDPFRRSGEIRHDETVYQDPNVDRQLAVGIGRARALYVLYPWKGKPILCRGAVMSYYEYPSNRRLTDLEWKGVLDSPACAGAARLDPAPGFIPGRETVILADRPGRGYARPALSGLLTEPKDGGPGFRVGDTEVAQRCLNLRMPEQMPRQVDVVACQCVHAGGERLSQGMASPASMGVAAGPQDRGLDDSKGLPAGEAPIAFSAQEQGFGRARSLCSAARGEICNQGGAEGVGHRDDPGSDAPAVGAAAALEGSATDLDRAHYFAILPDIAGIEGEDFRDAEAGLEPGHDEGPVAQGQGLEAHEELFLVGGGEGEGSFHWERRLWRQTLGLPVSLQGKWDCSKKPGPRQPLYECNTIGALGHSRRAGRPDAGRIPSRGILQFTGLQRQAA